MAKRAACGQGTLVQAQVREATFEAGGQAVDVRPGGGDRIGLDVEG